VAKRLKIIPIARTPSNAYRRDREISDLVRNQLRHVRRELQNWWANFGSKDPERFTTEQEASEYIRVVTRILHPQGAHAPRILGRPAPKSGVWLTDPADAPARKPKRSKKR
jgi:hypothetical protein